MAGAAFPLLREGIPGPARTAAGPACALAFPSSVAWEGTFMAGEVPSTFPCCTDMGAHRAGEPSDRRGFPACMEPLAPWPLAQGLNAGTPLVPPPEPPAEIPVPHLPLSPSPSKAPCAGSFWFQLLPF